MTAPALELNDGNSIPQVGLGTWPMKDDEVAQVVAQSVELGYRHFDTAVNYGNETGVGNGMRNSGIAREELFVTTKVPGRDHGKESTKRSLGESLERLGLDYVDLQLIHWPNPKDDKFVETWAAMVELREQGLTKSIGVSNFTGAHIDRIIAATGVTPAVNQVQLFPGVNRLDERAYAAEHNIVIEAWSPLGQGANSVYYGGHVSYLDNPTFAELAEKYGKTVGQIILRWHVQQGIVAIPKSSNPERLAQNLDVFSFDLTSDDMEQLAAVDRGTSDVADSDEHHEY